jgi:hypothetical protein
MGSFRMDLSYMQLTIRQATPEDIDTVADILREAARWLEESGMPSRKQVRVTRAKAQRGNEFLLSVLGVSCDELKNG